MRAIIATAFASVFMLAACEAEDEGPLEEAGDEMEEAADEAEEATDGR